MKFKIIENHDYYTEEARLLVQEYAYDAIDELKDASFDTYFTWFLEETQYEDAAKLKQAVKDFYIEAIDCGKIKQPKTMITSELTTYLESNADLIDKDITELINNCPDHLKHELTLVLAKIDDSLNESVLNEAIRPDLKRFIEQHAELLDEDNIEELYKQCPRELKVPLVRILNAASVGNNVATIKRATFLADSYDDEELINLVLSIGEHANDVFDSFDYIMNNWNEFFTHDMLNEDLLTENTLTNIENMINTAFAGTGCVITTDPHKKFYLVRTPLNNTYCIPVVQQGVKTSSDYNKRRYKGNGTVVNGKLVDSSGITLGPAYYGVSSNHNHYDYDDINLYQYSKYPSANGAKLSLTAFVHAVNSGRI